MKKLQELAKRRAEDFEQDLPEGHQDRFLEKLSARAQAKPTQRPALPRMLARRAMKVAASLLGAGLGLGLLYLMLNPGAPVQASQTADGLSLGDISPEYREVEIFYQRELDRKLKTLESLECGNGDFDKQAVRQEIDLIDTSYQQLRRELLNNTADERVIQAMIESYRVRDQLLERVIERVAPTCE